MLAKYSDPGLNKVVAPIIKLKDVKDLDQPHTVLVTADEMEDFFSRHVSFVIIIINYSLDFVHCSDS